MEYTYDAWGNVLSITGQYANSLGKDNPIRYRGYYYDSETGFYYLQSRYYDPAMRRFISADDPELLGASRTFIGYNLYAYCDNNPARFSDRTGKTSGVEALNKWATWGLLFPAADGPFPIGDLIYAGGLFVFGTWALCEAVVHVGPRPDILHRERIIPPKAEASVSEKDIRAPLLDSNYSYWSATILNGMVMPIAPLKYAEARVWVEMGNDLLCITHSAARAIVRFYPTARWDRAHGSLTKGYLNHYHLSSAHVNHIWYFGV